MHAVVAWSVEDELNGAGQLAHAFGVDPELKYGVHLVHGCVHRGGKQEGERQVGQPGEAALECALAQRRGEVVVLACVVYVMRRPQQVALVTRTVEAVVAWASSVIG